MRDDDDEPSDEIGKLIHSGIRREEDVGPAEYALPPGVPALQDALLEDEDLCRPTATRRHVMMLALGGATLVTGSFLTGRLSRPEPTDGGTHDRTGKRLTQEELKLVHAAQTWADAPLETLIGSATAFLWVFQLVEPDEKLLKGLQRLAEYAILDGGEKGYLTAVRILKNFEYVEAPAELDPYRADLQEVIWRWQMKQELRPR